jgi:hypothetical protein
LSLRIWAIALNSTPSNANGEYVEKHYPFGCSIFMIKTNVRQVLGLGLEKLVMVLVRFDFWIFL